MEKRSTLVMGASENPQRYSNMAIKLLRENGYKVFALGNRAGEVSGVPIVTTPQPLDHLDTVTMYLGARNQTPYYAYILSLKPRRIVFNPGAENEELEHLAMENGIEVCEACTLVMLRTGQY